VRCREYVDFLRAAFEASDLAHELRGKAEREGTGVPWRLRSVAELREGEDRAQRYLARIRTRLASLLPPALRGSALVLVLGENPPLDIGPSRPLEPERAERLKRIVLDRLAGQRLSDADQHFLAEALEVLEPIRPVLLRPALLPGFVPQSGSHVAVGATSAACGSWVMYAPTHGSPVIGQVEDGGVRIFRL
jgi:hypothetical protein